MERGGTELNGLGEHDIVPVFTTIEKGEQLVPAPGDRAGQDGGVRGEEGRITAGMEYAVVERRRQEQGGGVGVEGRLVAAVLRRGRGGVVMSAAKRTRQESRG